MTGFDVLNSRLIISGQLETQTPLRIGAGNSTDVTGSDNPVMKDSRGNPIIPGSSLKGALRAYFEAILQTLQHQTNMNLVCNVLTVPDDKDDNITCLSDELFKELKLSPTERNIKKSILDQRVVDESCLICRLFGSPWIGGKLFLRDLPLYEDEHGNRFWSGHYVFRDGVAIDRDTGTAADKRKYDFEAVPAGTRFDFKMQVDNADDLEMAIALLAVRTLERGQLQLGGARSRGTGWCRLVETKTEYEYYPNPLDLLLSKHPASLNSDEIEGKIKIFTDMIGQSHA